jgi:Ala-tRNA(Pro) deacylase
VVKINLNIMNNVKKFLEEHDIKYVWHEHPAVYTCEEAEKYCSHIPGVPAKNLFLRDQKGKKFFLFVTPAQKRIDLKKLAEKMETKKLSFASPERLKEKLGLEPGSVSPFGLLNDSEGEVAAYIDKEIAEADTVNFHPNVSIASIELKKEMFEKFLNSIKNRVEFIEM